MRGFLSKRSEVMILRALSYLVAKVARVPGSDAHGFDEHGRRLSRDMQDTADTIEAQITAVEGKRHGLEG